jgi:hypothetical protein
LVLLAGQYASDSKMATALLGGLELQPQESSENGSALLVAEPLMMLMESPNTP